MQGFLKDLTHSDYLMVGGGFAGLCGSLQYMLNVEEGKPFKWREFLVHMATSAAFGVIAFEIMTFEHIPDEVAAAICGMSGWMGTRIARIIEIVLPKIVNAIVLKYFGLTKKDIEQQDTEGK